MEAGTYDQVRGPSGAQAGWRAGLWGALRIRAYSILTDEALVRRARAKDHAAFDVFVARHRKRLYTLALTSLGNEEDAGDALCEVALAAFKSIDSRDPACTPGTWLYLQGLCTVLKRMNVPLGRYAFSSRVGAGAASSGDD